MAKNIILFQRRGGEEKPPFSYIGKGEIGGKAKGLDAALEIVQNLEMEQTGSIFVHIPRFTVVTTQYFDEFMQANKLYEIALSERSDTEIANFFQKALLPEELIENLHAFLSKFHTPLAVRSSSLLEDSLQTPYAGAYATQMLANQDRNHMARMNHLLSAIKYVYASTFFAKAKAYAHALDHSLENEKMAVILQEVVGLRHQDLFYPNLSGVARSYNFYPTGNSKPEDGVVYLALGLGKTVVDGECCWLYSPAYPCECPLYNFEEFLTQTQSKFWAIRVNKNIETRSVLAKNCLVQWDIDNSDNHTLRYIASTYNEELNCLEPGLQNPGRRILNFAPLLQQEAIPLNPLLKHLLYACEQSLGARVEMEFAMTFAPDLNFSHSFGLLQLRPMNVSHETVEIDEGEIRDDNLFMESENVLGNGIIDNICDIVYLKPSTFSLSHSKKIAVEIGNINHALLQEKRPYLLMGFGRWGTCDPSLGIPVNWGQISGAKAILESTLSHRDTPLSQGAHFFHNIANLRIPYFSIRHSDPYQIDWPRLRMQSTIDETHFVHWVRLPRPLKILVDGRKKRGVILYR